jgi:hypothetical protein
VVPKRNRISRHDLLKIGQGELFNLLLNLVSQLEEGFAGGCRVSREGGGILTPMQACYTSRKNKDPRS